MGTLIIDIETVGERFSDMDEETVAIITKWLDTTVMTPDERQRRLTELESGLGFSPLTGKIVALGVYDLERQQGTVYVDVAKGAMTEEVVGAFTLRPSTEVAMLQEFWEGALCYDRFVTFNGRAFDLPFLLHRSIVNEVTPTVDLMRYRYLTQQTPPYHIDLQDQLTFYGAMSRRPSIHLFCRAYGIISPKVDGVAGDDVARLYEDGKVRDIALYNTRDLLATAALYEKWQQYLAPALFRKLGDAINF